MAYKNPKGIGSRGKVGNSAKSPPEKGLSPGDADTLIQGLQTYKRTLEAQNAELRSSQLKIEEARSKYSDLYDFAPVGYFTFDEEMLFKDVNLTGAALLGMEREDLINKSFALFVKPEFQEILYQHRRKVLQGGGKQFCELGMKSEEGRDLYVSIVSIAGKDPGTIRSALSDITEHKLTEIRIHQLSSELMNAQEQERKRIAHEIHDELTGSLSVLTLSLETKIGKLERGEPLNLDNLKRMISLLKQTLDQTRRIMNNLRPPILDDLGLLPTIDWFLREYQKIHSHIEIEKQTDVQEKEIPDNLKLVIFRVLQESLNHIAQNADQAAIRVTLSDRDGNIHFAVEEKGGRFSPESYNKGLGLESMRERVEASGGCFSTDFSKGEPTAIEACWPCSPAYRPLGDPDCTSHP